MGIEKGSRSPVNLMTQVTYDSLKQEVEEARGNVKQSLLDIGAAAGSESDWHDNAAFDHANQRHDVDRSSLATIEARLRNVEIIKPSRKTDKVGIGNDVVVRFQGEDEDEVFTILGPADSGRNPGWISYESPLGAALMDRKKGDTVSFQVRHDQQSVKILNILTGSF